jgi:CBS domain-containing protein
MTSQDVRRLPVIGDAGELVGILSIDDLLLHSAQEADQSSISYKEIVTAAKSILRNRARGHVHDPAEIVAVERNSRTAA